MSVKQTILDIFSPEELKAIAESDMVRDYLRGVAKNAKSVTVRAVHNQLPEKARNLLSKANQVLLAENPDEPVKIRVKIDEEQKGQGFGSLLAAASSVAGKIAPILAQVASKVAPVLSNTVVKNVGLGMLQASGAQLMNKMMGGELEGGKSRYIHYPLPLTENQLGNLAVAVRNDHDSFTAGLNKEQVAAAFEEEGPGVLIPCTQRQINQVEKAHGGGVGCRLKFSKTQLKSMKKQFAIQDGTGFFQDIQDGKYEFPVGKIKEALDKVDKGVRKSKKILEAISDPVD